MGKKTPKKRRFFFSASKKKERKKTRFFSVGNRVFFLLGLLSFDIVVFMLRGFVFEKFDRFDSFDSFFFLAVLFCVFVLFCSCSAFYFPTEDRPT